MVEHREPDGAKAYETTDLAVRSLTPVLGGLLVFAALAAVVSYGLVQMMRQTTQANLPPATAIETTRIEPPQPRLQATPRADLAAVRGHDLTQLNGYGWVDRRQGIAHIPIARAMTMVAGKPLDGPP